MQRFLLTIQYDGKAYHGWQRQQAHLITVQAVVEDAIADLVQAPVNVLGASRTDAGVHARAMAAQVDLETRLRGEELRRAIDVRLPADVALISIDEVSDDFQCRYETFGKCYAYRIHNSRRRHPLTRHDSYFLPRPLNLEAMREASAHLIGKHDFSAFATLLSEHQDKLTSQPDPTRPDKPVGNIRELFAIEIVRQSDRLTFLVFGDGFLRGMVRGLVGTLVNVGDAKFTPDEVKAILESKDRRQAGANLPAHGLTLERVFYQREDLDAWREKARRAASGNLKGIGLVTPMELLE